LLDIYIDADACPVKKRLTASPSVMTSACSSSPIPCCACGRRLGQAGAAPEGFGSVDDWIAEHVEPANCSHCRHPARRALSAEKRTCRGPKGYAFNEDSIGAAMATRALMDELRQWALSPAAPLP